ncbi:Uncharacterised protein [Mycobacteroides abscessus subsp. abscessus]|nr:Uncharacterised protein [Mycobacteroides abscessus subsp. abscessus]
MHDVVEPTRRQHAIACDDVEVAFFGVLRQIAEIAGPGHRSGVGLGLARENAQRGRLTCAIAADEADPVAGLNTQC